MARALLLIDLQQEFTRRTAAGWPRSNPGAEARAAAILSAFRARGLPVIHVHHDDPRPDSGFRADRPGGVVMPEVAPLPGEVVFVKRTSSAFSGTGLAAYLEGQGIADLVVVGAAVNYCVNSTLRAACDLGLRCTLVTDATFGFGVTGPDGRAHDPDTVLSVTLGGLIPEFAAGITSEALLAAL